MRKIKSPVAGIMQQSVETPDSMVQIFHEKVLGGLIGASYLSGENSEQTKTFESYRGRT